MGFLCLIFKLSQRGKKISEKKIKSMFVLSEYDIVLF